MEVWTVALLTLSGAALRLSMLDRCVEYDEAFTYTHFASGTFWNAVSNYVVPNNHIFHTICLWATTRVFGLSLLSLRLTVLIAGIALVPLTYLLGREASGPVAAAFAAALMAGCRIFALYSVDARGYGLQAALFVAAMVLTPRFVRRPSKGLCAALVVTTALALYTVPTFAYGVGTIFIWGLQLALMTREARWSRTLWLTASALLAAMLTGLLYAPAIDFIVHEHIHWTRPYGAKTFTEMCMGLFENFTTWLPWYWVVAILALIALDAVADCVVRRSVPLALIWLGWPLLSLAVYMSVASRAPFPRSFVFVVPILFVLAGRALELGVSFARHKLQPAGAYALALVGLAAIVLSTALPAYADYREVMRPDYLNSRYVFEKFLRPLKPGDELAAAAIVMEAVQIYAQIEGIALSRMSQRWSMSIMQRSGPDGYTFRELASPGQRFTMIAKNPRDRRILPRALNKRVNAGALEWVARARLAPYASDSPIVWELVASH